LARIILSHALLESIRFVMSRKERRDIYGLINTVAALSIRNGLENTSLPARGHMPRSGPVLFGKSQSHQRVERSVGLEEIKLGHYGDFSLGLFSMLERDKACRLRLGEDQIAIFGRHAHLQLIRHSVIRTVELCHGVGARR
jgi:hypothetical protein